MKKSFAFSLLLCVLIHLPGIITAQFRYPLMLALDRQTGFMIDSLEAGTYNLFPYIDKTNLNYMVIIGNDSSRYSVKSVYKNGDVVDHQYALSTIKEEWQKLALHSKDSGNIDDFSTVKIYFPEMVSFVVADSNFNQAMYVDFWQLKSRKNYFFLNTGISFSNTSGGVNVTSFMASGHLKLDRMLFTLHYQNGKSNIHWFNIIIGKVDYQLYREAGISGGWILGNQDIFLSALAGVASVKIEDVKYTSNNLLFSNGNTEHIRKYNLIGFPIGFLLSVPVTTGVGFCIEAHTTIVSESKPTYTVGLGLRFGRIGTKIVSN